MASLPNSLPNSPAYKVVRLSEDVATTVLVVETTVMMF
jgi:hypothetical protein